MSREAGPSEQQAYANGIAAERERCAKIVEGEIYKERYRAWPRINDGNSDRDSQLVKHCDALAALIRGGD